MSRINKGNLAAYIIIGIALIAALFNAWQRLEIERSHKQSQVLLDWTQVYDAAQRENLPLDEVLEQFAPYSGGALIKEPLLGELQNQGVLTLRTAEALRWDLQNSGRAEAAQVKEGYTYLIFKHEEDMARILHHIQAKLPGAVSQIFPLDGADILATSAVYADLMSMGVGFPQAWLEVLEGAGLGAAVQIRSWNGFNPAGAQASLDDLAGYEILGVGFNDADLPGVFLPAPEYKEACEFWAEGINDLNSSLVTMEFFAQNGMQTMGAAMEQNVLRLHSVTERDMQTTVNREKALDRYQLAASERNMSLLLVRFLPQATVAENVEFFDEINHALWDKGIVQTKPAAPQPLKPGSISLVLISAGIIAGAWLLARRFHISPALCNTLAVLGVLLSLALIFTGRVGLLQKLYPLLGVLVFPALSMIAFMPRTRQGAGRAVRSLLLMTAGSLIGAVLMVGMLADGNFMLGLKIFTGVKVAHLIPVVLIGLWFYFFRENENPWRKTSHTLNTPLTSKYLFIAIAIVGVLGVYLMRTGNESLALPEWERSFRAFMDQVMFVRPRTKEFMIGHPLLLLVCYWGYRDNLLPFLVLGAIGQVSLVNTFAHIHTPLMISVLRTVNGLVLGLIAGLVLIALVNLGLRLYKERLLPLAEKKLAEE